MNKQTAALMEIPIGAAAAVLPKKNRPPLGRGDLLLRSDFFYRCRTRSRISCVRPWFQNWVPI